MTIDINDERTIRIEKLNQFRQAGQDPYPATIQKTHTIKEALSNFDTLSVDQSEVTLCGRIRLIRRHGGLTFFRVEDQDQEMQIMFRKQELGEEKYEMLKLYDIADFLQASGKLITSKTGEKSLDAASFTIISKAILPLPEKFHGLKDEETRYRQRYLDLITNKEVKDLFRNRTKFIQAMRSFLISHDFLEVETPVLEHVPGGAEAEPFITKHNTLDIDLYLRISLELHLKRLIVGGYDKVFEIGKVFRNEGMSTQHLQEFTEMEFYWAYANNEQLMPFVQSLYQHMIQSTVGSLQVTCKDTVLDFAGEWPKLDYNDLFKKYTDIDLNDVDTVEQLRDLVKSKKIDIKIDPKAGLGRLIDQVYKRMVRPNLVQPCFLINHPVAVSPLAKRQADNPRFVERHQVLIMGAEVGNGFSELNDPIDQRGRFEEQMKLREAGDNEAQMIDDDFITALEHGMPPTAGFGVGIDRLFMIITNQESIRDTVLFPTMKPKHIE